MDCKVIGDKIIDFHFGKIAEDNRHLVETHLLDCSACLAEYFALKRDIEIPLPSEALPSPEVRPYLMKEFEQFRQSILSVESRLWMRSNRKSLIVGSVLAAAALLFIIFSGQFRSHPKAKFDMTPVDSNKVHTLDESIDSGRTAPAHINII